MKKKIQVCYGRACRSFGSERILGKIELEKAIKVDENNDFCELTTSHCMGYCSNAPNVRVDGDKMIFNAEEETIIQKIDNGGEDVSGDFIDVDELFDKSI